MAFTKVVGAGIHTLSNITSHNINSSGIITATKFVGPFDGSSGDFSGNVTIDGNLTVNGTTTTLDTNLTEVDKVEVAANNTTVGVAITQSGSGDLLRLYDGASQVVTVDDVGRVGLGSAIPAARLDVSPTIQIKNTASNGSANLDINAANGGQARINLYAGVSGGANRASRIDFHNQGNTPQWTIGNDFAQNGTNYFSIRHGNENAIQCNPDATVSLYDDGDESLRTDAAGILVPEKVIHLGDTDTFMKFDTNTISFETSGSQHLRVASNGNIGIGTANNNPTSKLHVLVDGVGQGIHIANKENLYNAASTGYSDIRFSFRDYQTGGSSGAPAIIRAQSHNAYATSRSSKLIFLTSSSDGTNTPTEKMRIEHDGDVGIGTDNPVAKLQLEHSGLDAELFRTWTTTGSVRREYFLKGPTSGNGNDPYRWCTGNSHSWEVDNSEKMRINYLGNVGINEASNINGRLHVQHDALAENILFATRYNDQTTDKAILAITEAQMTGMAAGGLVIGNHNRDMHIGPVFDVNGAVTTTDITGIRITSDGQLFVGTPNKVNTSPSKLQVAATDATGSAILARFNASVYSSYLDFYKSRSNTLGTAYVVNDDDHLGALRFYGADGSNSGYTTAAEIYGSCDGGSGASGDMAGRITFHTRPDGAGQSMQERLRIDSNGYIGIDYATPYNGLTINKEGDYWDNNGNTYAHPEGRVLSTWGGDRNDDTDYWVGFVGKYLKPSATVNILLQPHVGNFNNQAGMYIAGEATGNFNSDFTLGAISSGNVAGRGTTASSGKRATKSELLRIKHDGRLILGANTNHSRTINSHVPKLQVTGTNYSHSTISIINNANDNNGSYIFLGKQRSGAVGGNTAVNANDIIGELRFPVADGTDMNNYAAQIQVRAQLDATSNNTPGYIDFYTTRQNGSSEHKMRMTQNSNHSHLFSMGTGTSNLNNATTPDRTSVKIGGLLHLEGPFGHNATPGMYYNCYSGGNDLFYRGTGVPSGGDRRPAAYGQKFGGHYFYGDTSSTAWSAQQQITTMQLNMNISSQGYVTKPQTPAFFATHTGLSNTHTGTLTYNTSGNGYYNNGGHLNVSTGKFTAPCNGIYHFHFHGFFQSGQNNSAYEVTMRRANSNGSGVISVTRQYGYRDQATNQYGPSISMQYTGPMTAGQTMEMHTGFAFHGSNGFFFGGHLIG